MCLFFFNKPFYLYYFFLGIAGALDFEDLHLGLTILGKTPTVSGPYFQHS